MILMRANATWSSSGLNLVVMYPKVPYVPWSKHSMGGMVIHPMMGIPTMGMLIPILYNGLMTIPNMGMIIELMTMAHVNTV